MKIKTFSLNILFIGMTAFILFLIFWLTIGISSILQDKTILYEKLILTISLDLAAITAMYSIYNLYQLLSITEDAEIFSQKSLALIRNIRRSVFFEFVLLWGILPATYYFADKGDAPGIMILGLGVVSVPLLFGIFMTAIEKFFARAIQLDAENKLTI